MHPASPSALFFHIFSRAREKIWPPEAMAIANLRQPLSLGCAETAPLEGEPIYFPAVVPRRGFLVAGESAEPGWYHLF